MTTNRLAKPSTDEKSPTEPNECCVWANARMKPEMRAEGWEWVVTGDRNRPIALRRPGERRMISATG